MTLLSVSVLVLNTCKTRNIPVLFTKIHPRNLCKPYATEILACQATFLNTAHQKIPGDFVENDIIINIFAFDLKVSKVSSGLFVWRTVFHLCNGNISASITDRFDGFDTPAETTNAFHNHQQGQYSHPPPPIIRSSPCISLFPSKTDIRLVGQGQRS